MTMAKRRPKRPVFKMTKEMLEFYRATGSEGGKVGGVKRWEGVSAEDRAAHGRKAAGVRWAKRTAAEKAAHARMTVEARERKRAAAAREAKRRAKKAGR